MIHVLLIDDDRRHSELLRSWCLRHDIDVDCTFDGEQGLRRLAATRPDLVLLDVMLPGKDGFTLCREIRRRNKVPVIMLTARGDVGDRVTGLELGADDYIAKPFDPRELVARIHTVLRRTQPVASSAVLEFEQLRIDPASRTVSSDGVAVELTTMEYELLLLFASNPGRDFSRDDILASLRGIDAALLTRSVDILVSRLRAKLGDTSRPGRIIHTVWGRGYRFTARPAGSP
ncbi:MAG: response regulator transcription factor [Proteobacteria bacterium]|nr:response regulator transcription factor [Pseudomonadota bacterium]MBK7116254.1 response regulator transcription factor [Pseudomonadota bacterium]